MSSEPPPFEIVDLPALPGVACPCGTARRAFLETVDFPASIHLTEISELAHEHYHKRITEVYVIWDAEPGAGLVLNGEFHPVRPGMAILIRPGTRHFARGTMKVLLIAWPKFDPTDEHVTS